MMDITSSLCLIVSHILKLKSNRQSLQDSLQYQHFYIRGLGLGLELHSLPMNIGFNELMSSEKALNL